jgi:hypothetical protein
MNGSRWIPLPYLLCIGLVSLLAASVAAAMAAPTVWNAVAVLDLGSALRELRGAFLLATIALGCVLVALVESSLHDPSA